MEDMLLFYQRHRGLTYYLSFWDRHDPGVCWSVVGCRTSMDLDSTSVRFRVLFPCVSRRVVRHVVDVPVACGHWGTLNGERRVTVQLQLRQAIRHSVVSRLVDMLSCYSNRTTLKEGKVWEEGSGWPMDVSMWHRSGCMASSGREKGL